MKQKSVLVAMLLLVYVLGYISMVHAQENVFISTLTKNMMMYDGKYVAVAGTILAPYHEYPTDSEYENLRGTVFFKMTDGQSQVSVHSMHPLGLRAGVHIKVYGDVRGKHNYIAVKSVVQQ